MAVVAGRRLPLFTIVYWAFTLVYQSVHIFPIKYLTQPLRQAGEAMAHDPLNQEPKPRSPSNSNSRSGWKRRRSRDPSMASSRAGALGGWQAKGRLSRGASTQRAKNGSEAVIGRIQYGKESYAHKW